MSHFNKQLIKALTEFDKKVENGRIISVKVELDRPNTAKAEIEYYHHKDIDAKKTISFTHSLTVHKEKSDMTEEDVEHLYDVLQREDSRTTEINIIEQVSDNKSLYEVTLTLYEDEYNFPISERFKVLYNKELDSIKNLEPIVYNEEYEKLQNKASFDEEDLFDLDFDDEDF